MKWMPLDYYHQKPKEGVLYSISDKKSVIHDVCLINGVWYRIDDEDPIQNFTPTHYLVLELPR